jgi:hypothetical protein
MYSGIHAQQAPLFKENKISTIARDVDVAPEDEFDIENATDEEVQIHSYIHTDTNSFIHIYEYIYIYV